jgi:hypothetical protein
MRDSFSPRQKTSTTQSPMMDSSLQSRFMPASPSHGEGGNHNRLLKRPPFSPTNPRNIRTSGTKATFDDPWKVGSSGSVKGSRDIPPNPESRMTRVSSGPQRSLSRGRLMEGPSLTSPTNDMWDDDSAWRLPIEKMNAFPSPSLWDRRTRSAVDFSPRNNISDPHLRLSDVGSGDSGERSLYDDSGEKIMTARHRSPAAASPRAAAGGPLGSSSRPIVTTNTSAPSPRATQDGSLNRPIAIHDFVDLLDEREKDVLQLAARKKMPVTSIDVHKRSTIDFRGKKDILPAPSKPRETNGGALVPKSPVVATNSAIVVDDLPPVDGKIATTPRQNKGIMGFFRGSVRAFFRLKYLTFLATILTNFSLFTGTWWRKTWRS